MYKLKNKYKQGKFSPLNPKKYIGDCTKIIYRSSWELKLMTLLDKHPGVIEWKSEETIIPYISPKDKKCHRYFVDFWAKMNTLEGIKIFLIEVKPQKQVDPPKQKKRLTKAFLNECLTFAVNQAKFDAARAYCKKRDWQFVIMNEKDLGI